MNIRKLVKNFLSGRCQISRKAQTNGVSSSSKNEKVFCIGLNKTGTTSIEKALADLGYCMGEKSAGDLLIDEWAQRNFKPIIKFCKTADAFQDLPFSLPYTYQALDAAYPDAKFILSVRKNSCEWYSSLTRFHSNLWADGNRVPNKEDLKKAYYREEGFVWRMVRLRFDTPLDDIYNKETLTAYYDRHLANVREYFRHKPEKLLEVNVADPHAYGKFCKFLGHEPKQDAFPWLNKSQSNAEIL